MSPPATSPARLRLPRLHCAEGQGHIVMGAEQRVGLGWGDMEGAG